MKRVFLYGRLTLSFVLVLTFCWASAQNRGVSVRGYARDQAGEPLFQAAILLEGTNYGALTNESGFFEIPDVSQGMYNLRVTYVGYNDLSKKITVETGQNQVHNLSMTANEQILQTVEITGRKEKDYKNSLSFIGTRTATPIKEVPQTISYITKEVMQDQGATRIGDIVKNVSGVNMFTFYDDLTIRGFRNQGSGSNQLFNGMRTFSGYWRQPVLNYLERVEIIKGPASALYGNTSPGGTVNKVTKKPLEEEMRSVSFTVGSFNTVRMLADFTGPANKSKTILYRLNLGYENAKSFRDLVFDKNIVIAPSISFLPTNKTRVNIDAVFNKSNSRLDRGQAIISDQGLYSTPVSSTVVEVNDHLNEETYMVTTSLTHEFSKNISFNASYLRTGYNQDVLEHRSNNGYAKDKLGNDITTLIGRQTNIRYNEQFNDSFTAYLNFNFNTGSLGHKLVAGYDYANSIIPPGSSQSNATGYLLKDGSATTRYVVKDSAKYQFYSYNGTSIPKPNTPSFDLVANQHILQDMGQYVYASAANGVTIPVFSRLSGAYVQDQIKIGKLNLLLALRYDNYKDIMNYKMDSEYSESQHVVLPRFGAVYEFNKHVNGYVTYAMGYNPQAAATQANPLTGGPFDPITSNLQEAGIKSDWLNKRLNVNASIYRIQQNNTLISANSEDNPDLMIQLGEEISKGLELEMVGNLAPNLSMILTYAYNDSKMAEQRTSDNQELIFEQKPNTPKNQGSAWLKFDFPYSGKLKGLGLGLGANYVGERLFGRIMAGSTATSFNGPAFLLANSGVYYRVNKMQIQVNVNNMFNKTHWVGGYDAFRLYPGSPVNWQTTIRYNF